MAATLIGGKPKRPQRTSSDVTMTQGKISQNEMGCSFPPRMLKTEVTTFLLIICLSLDTRYLFFFLILYNFHTEKKQGLSSLSHVCDPRGSGNRRVEVSTEHWSELDYVHDSLRFMTF